MANRHEICSSRRVLTTPSRACRGQPAHYCVALLSYYKDHATVAFRFEEAKQELSYYWGGRASLHKSNFRCRLRAAHAPFHCNLWVINHTVRRTIDSVMRTKKKEIRINIQSRQLEEAKQELSYCWDGCASLHKSNFCCRVRAALLNAPFH